MPGVMYKSYSETRLDSCKHSTVELSRNEFCFGEVTISEILPTGTTNAAFVLSLRGPPLIGRSACVPSCYRLLAFLVLFHPPSRPMKRSYSNAAIIFRENDIASSISVQTRNCEPDLKPVRENCHLYYHLGYSISAQPRLRFATKLFLGAHSFPLLVSSSPIRERP